MLRLALVSRFLFALLAKAIAKIGVERAHAVFANIGRP